MLMPKPAAKLLAKHLARQVFIQKAPIRDVNQIDGKGSDRPLWTEESCEKLAQSFLSEEYEEERQTPKTDAEILREKIEQLNRLQVEIDTAQGTGSLPIQSGTVATDDVSSEYLDKAQVIAELQKREIKFDARMNKSNLEALLKSST